MIFWPIQKMATLLGTVFSTDENMAVQADVNFIRTTVESPAVEFDQVKYEEYLSSGSKSLKAMTQYRKVSLEIRSQVSLETSPKMVCVSNAVSDRARINVSHETPVAKGGEGQSSHRSPLQIPRPQVTGSSQ